MKTKYYLLLGLSLFCCVAVPAFAEEFFCEIMTVQGSAYLSNSDTPKRLIKEGDLLKNGDLVEVDPGGFVDVAYDKEWNNITRIGEKSKVTIHSVFPTGLKMEEGDIFARLQKLPKGSTFEIHTPTAVAAVRGTVYWTEHRDGETSVFNYSPSPVEVFNLDKEGNLEARVVVDQNEKTEVFELGEAPKEPQPMTSEELDKAGVFDHGIAQEVKGVLEEGREGNAPSLDDMNKDMKLHMDEMRDQYIAIMRKEDDNTGSGPNDPNSGDGGDPTKAGDPGSTGGLYNPPDPNFAPTDPNFIPPDPNFIQPPDTTFIENNMNNTISDIDRAGTITHIEDDFERRIAEFNRILDQYHQMIQKLTFDCQTISAACVERDHLVQNPPHPPQP